MRGVRSIVHDPRVLLGLIALAGLALRLVDAGARINEDEGYSWLVASAPNAGAFLSRLARYENTPPLFYLMAAVLPLDTETWLRAPAILAGVLSIPLLYAIVRPLLGVRPALLASLGLAVAPFAVSYADYARGFTVAGLGVLVALLGAQRIAAGAGRVWWWAYVLGGVWALYSEYYAGLFLLAIVGALLVLGGRPRGETFAFGLLPLVGFVPWLPQLARSVNDVGKTKLPLAPSTPSPGLIRDALVPLFFGEHGAAASTGLRGLQAVVLVAALGLSCRRLRRRASREAFWLLGGVLIGVLTLYLLATATDTDIFRERYMTIVLPLAAAVFAGAIATWRWRLATPVCGAVLVLLGTAVVFARAGREYEPDSAAAIRAVEARGYRTILTNSPEVLFYGRHLDVRLDRPFGLGNGDARLCPASCAVLDDTRFSAARGGAGASIVFGTMVIRFPPGPR